MRSLISFRIAILDVWAICAATFALGAAFVWRGLEDGVSAGSLVTLNRPILGIVTLVLLASAALGSWQGLPLSVVLVGLGEVGLTIGSLIYSFQAIGGAYVDDRWAGLAWAAGAGLAILASEHDHSRRRSSRASSSAERRFRSTRRAREACCSLTVGALVLTVGVAFYGLHEDSRVLTLIGLFASVSIGIAMALRARDSIQTAESAYGRLDRALADAERARDELATRTRIWPGRTRRSRRSTSRMPTSSTSLTSEPAAECAS